MSRWRGRSPCTNARGVWPRWGLTPASELDALALLRDPDRVVAVLERRAVEPSVARLHDEAGVLEQRAPLLGRQPGERHRRLALRAAHRQRQRALHLVPTGELEDAGLALEPAA